ncbi:hypothetical protein BSL82_15750 [Tardibacter chloracetimidivorans]|uniref:HTH marR-type domain-containing protein n=1 Tax=Tardibacter chloracetimidivorans TaxID=1921510 RepID=A0A1L3ZY89_9SPHN|nr:helix-turn-helix domain-containing protein [Tardibacter chloracetimidivorans]API60559.1 hypothetical protein BSL82_15750 [Tardibacter chloracetimidivorans]
MAPILKALKEAEGPMLVRDVVQVTGIPRPRVSGALARLHSRGLVGRYKVEEQRLGPSGHPTTYRFWCYQFIVENDE